MDRKRIITKAELIEEIWELKNKSPKVKQQKTLGSENTLPLEGGITTLPLDCLTPSTVLRWSNPLRGLIHPKTDGSPHIRLQLVRSLRS